MYGPEYTKEELIECFRQHLTCDKSWVNNLCPRFTNLIIGVGLHIKKHAPYILGIDVEEYQELWEFMDGNGFIIRRDDSPSMKGRVGIEIIYSALEEFL